MFRTSQRLTREVRLEADPSSPVIDLDAPTRPTDLPPPVYERAIADPAPVEAHRSFTRRRYAFDSLICGLAGAYFAITGIVAILRSDLTAPLSTPIIQVGGYRHTAVLGLIEVGVGAVLLLVGAATSRTGAIVTSAILGIAALVAVIQIDDFQEQLALERSFAWQTVVVAAIVLLAATLVLRWTTQRTMHERR